MNVAAWVASIVGVLGGLGGLAALLLVPLQRRKIRIDAAAVIVDSAMDLLQPLQARVEEVEKELIKVQGIVHAIRAELTGARPSIEKMRGIVGIPRNGT